MASEFWATTTLMQSSRQRSHCFRGVQKIMKAIVVGILPQERIRERMLAIARGEFKPKPTEPKIWFTSMRSLAEVLSDENRALLKVIQEAKPHSISSLADITGRKPGNLSRTLKTMSNYGFVEMKRENRHVRPIAKVTEFRIVA
jgi:predicted transcriptional regulator